ncbi:MAG: hypothetical protein HUU29_10475 [Planctomycetaceae bacterium]|nr:hypothetical protein [Planctomycetaceae bacterium]
MKTHSDNTLMSYSQAAARLLRQQAERLFPFSTQPQRPNRLQSHVAWSLRHDGHIFVFNKPLDIDVTYHNDVWVYANDEFRLVGQGETKDEALADLSEEFAFIWDEYTQERDAQLHPSGKLLKQKLLDLVRRIHE